MNEINSNGITVNAYTVPTDADTACSECEGTFPISVLVDLRGYHYCNLCAVKVLRSCLDTADRRIERLENSEVKARGLKREVSEFLKFLAEEYSEVFADDTVMRFHDRMVDDYGVDPITKQVTLHARFTVDVTQVVSLSFGADPDDVLSEWVERIEYDLDCNRFSADGIDNVEDEDSSTTSVSLLDSHVDD